MTEQPQYVGPGLPEILKRKEDVERAILALLSGFVQYTGLEVRGIDFDTEWMLSMPPRPIIKNISLDVRIPRFR